jgi:hypothetical protein
MWNNAVLLGSLFLLTGLISCGTPSEKSNSPVVAELGESKLHLSDINQLFGNEAKSADLNVKIYVHNWIRNEVVLQYGSKTLLPEEKDFSKELLAYENSLLRYKIESKYLDENIDTVVSRKELEEYYEANASNFELKENYVKVRILKMSAGFIEVNKRKEMVTYSDSLGKVAYNTWVGKHKLFSVIHDSSWVKWDHMKEIVPIKPYSDEYFLINNSYRELWADGDLWVINLTDFQLKDNKSPFEMVEGRINSILINKRKMSLVKKMEKELFSNAVENGEIKLDVNEN